MERELGDLFQLAELRVYALHPLSRRRDSETKRHSPETYAKIEEFRRDRRDDLERALGFDPAEQRQLEKRAQDAVARASERENRSYDPVHDHGEVGWALRAYPCRIRRRMHELKAGIARLNDALEDLGEHKVDRRAERPVEPVYDLDV